MWPTSCSTPVFFLLSKEKLSSACLPWDSVRGRRFCGGITWPQLNIVTSREQELRSCCFTSPTGSIVPPASTTDRHSESRGRKGSSLLSDMYRTKEEGEEAGEEDNKSSSQTIKILPAVSAFVRLVNRDDISPKTDLLCSVTVFWHLVISLVVLSSS